MKAWDELSALEQSECLYSDMYKDCYGVRPRFDQTAWSLEDYERELASLALQIEMQVAEEEVRHEEAVARFEETVKNALAFGAKDRKQAISWVLENETDFERFEFREGLPFGYVERALAA